MQSVKDERQTILLCGVNAHFQNSKAEKRIWYLQQKSFKHIHHAKARWTSAVKIFLCTYDLRQKNYIKNCLPDQEYGTIPLEHFT